MNIAKSHLLYEPKCFVILPDMFRHHSIFKQKEFLYRENNSFKIIFQGECFKSQGAQFSLLLGHPSPQPQNLYEKESE